MFTSEFKLKASKLSQEGYPPDKVFRRFGFEPSMFKPKYCEYILKKWRARLSQHGGQSLCIESRGRKRLIPKEDMLDEMDIEDLKAIIRIQQDIIEGVEKRAALAKKK